MTQIRSQFKNADESLSEADSKFRSGKFAEAEPLYLLALVLLERSFPEDHPQVLTCMERLGDTFYASEKWKDAAPVYRRLVGIREKLADINQFTVSALFKLARTYERLNQYDDAETHYQRAARIGEEIPGPLLGNLLDAYASMLRKTGRSLSDAEQLEQAAAAYRLRLASQAEAKQPESISAPTTEERGQENPTSTQAGSASPPSSQQAPVVESKALPQDQNRAIPSTGLSGTNKSQPLGTQPGGVQPGPASGISQSDNKGRLGGSSMRHHSMSETGMFQVAQDLGTGHYSVTDLDTLVSGQEKPSPPPPPIRAKSISRSPSIPREPSVRPAALSLSQLNQPPSPSPEKTIAPSSSKPPQPATTPPTAKTDTPAKNQSQIDSSRSRAFNLSDLDAIKTPIVQPTALQSEGEPESTVSPEEPARKDTRRGLSSTRSGLSKVESPKMTPLVRRRILMTVGGVVLIGVWLFIMFKLLFSQGIKPAEQEELSTYAGKAFKSADFQQSVAFKAKGFADLFEHNKRYMAKYKGFDGSFRDELAAITGAYDGNIWLRETPQGLQFDDGAILYSEDSINFHILDEMWDLADAAQKYYAKCGRYPCHRILDPPRLKELDKKLTYVNPINKLFEIPELFEVPWPASENPSRPTDKTELELRWEKGDPFNSGMHAYPAHIFCAHLGWPKISESLMCDFTRMGSTTMDDFFVEGYDENGRLFPGKNGKIFLIALKKGLNCTNDCNPSLVPAGWPPESEINICVSKEAACNKGNIIFKYLALVILLVGLVIVSMNWKQIEDRIRQGE